MSKSKQFSWITKDLIEKITENDREIKNNEKLESFNISNVCAEGDNFVSYLLRLEVFLKNSINIHRKSYIIKTINRESRFGKFVDLGILFYKIQDKI